MNFTKPTLSYSDQVALLKSRGFIVVNDARLIRWLSHSNYYRLSGYLLPFRQKNAAGDFLEDFVAGTTLEQLIDLCKFDARLRLLFIQAMERIELSLRSTISYVIAHNHGPFGYTDKNTYSSWFLNPHPKTNVIPFDEFMGNLTKEENRTKEAFVKHYRSKYTSETHLPIWMATELMTFGTLSMMCAGVKSGIKKQIAAEYGINEKPFQNWLQVLSSVRNICAHHSRFWNKQLGVSAVIPNGWIYSVPYPDRVYTVAMIVQTFLDKIAPDSRWKYRLRELMDSHPKVDISSMGFPSDWHECQPWKSAEGTRIERLLRHVGLKRNR